MSENARKYSTISFNVIHANDLQEVCKSLDMNKVDFVESAIQFFKQTGIDPRQKTDFRSETNRIIGFLKTQDKNAQAHFAQLIDRIGDQSSTDPTIMVKMLGAMNQMLENQTKIMEQLQTMIALDSQR